MKIAGIPRNPQNSPNMSNKDMAIFSEITERLKERGHSIQILDEKEVIPNTFDAVFHMSRTEITLKNLSEYEKSGRHTINTVNGVQNCSRNKVIEIFDRHKIRQPAFCVISSDKTIPNLKYPGWLKKYRGWSYCIHDVQYVKSEQELREGIKKLAENGCTEYVYCEHITGDLIKFYGVTASDFFRYRYPEPSSTKFGLEKINGPAHKYKFDEKELRTTVFEAARTLGITVFGGDCIITENREIFIIDFNDFPSFSAYTKEAAEAITDCIEKTLQRKNNF